MWLYIFFFNLELAWIGDPCPPQLISQGLLQTLRNCLSPSLTSLLSIFQHGFECFSSRTSKSLQLQGIEFPQEGHTVQLLRATNDEASKPLLRFRWEPVAEPLAARSRPGKMTSSDVNFFNASAFMKDFQNQ